MKSRISIVIASLLLVSGISLQPSMGQEKTKEDKDREYMIQQEIDRKKKEMSEAQKRVLEESRKQLEEQQKTVDQALENLQNGKDAGMDMNEYFRIFRNYGDKSFNPGDTWIFNPGMGSYYGHGFGSDSERTSWNFERSVKDDSFARDYIMDVGKSARTVVMSVNGDSKTGSIKIKILSPDGKVYADIVIDEFGNMNWRKSFNISDEENKDKVGEWKFRIEAAKATGNFKLSFQTF